MTETTDTSAEDCIRQAQGLRSSMWATLGVSPHGGELAFSLYPSFRNIPISGRWTCFTIRHMVLPSDVLMNIELAKRTSLQGGPLRIKRAHIPLAGLRLKFIPPPPYRQRELLQPHSCFSVLEHLQY